MSACPCGSGREYADCCEPFIEGRAFPPTAEALMRARYTAYSRGAFDYLQRTTHPDSNDDVDWADLEKSAAAVSWDKLEILSTEDGQPEDTHGVVTFWAHMSYEGYPLDHRERSIFKKDAEGHWLYVDGQVLRPEPIRRDHPKVGRNDPCPCGSGKKYKKCCGAA